MHRSHRRRDELDEQAPVFELTHQHEHPHHHNQPHHHHHHHHHHQNQQQHPHHHPQKQHQHQQHGRHESCQNNRIAEIIHHHELKTLSPVRDDNYVFGPYYTNSVELTDPEDTLRLKWLDNSPRMSRLREHRYKRLINKLEQFELWDIEQEQKQKQYEMARDQRYRNITDRLKSQEFCVNMMKKRHESDLETTRELELYSSDHLYIDAMDDPKAKYIGPITQYRKFQNEMDDKLKTLHKEVDQVNPRYQIEQAIIPRLERTRELYSVEPEVYTYKGKRVLKRPNLGNKYDTVSLKSYDPNRPKLKPIIHESYKARPKTPNGKNVNFNDDIEYSNSKEKSKADEA